jgi:eukaryotic-like serine/threonine-protein kinase
VPLAPAPGAIIAGRYRLNRLLDEGGMGVVWAAEHLLTGRTVALKLLKGPGAQDPETRSRLIREARAACAVRHPSVVEVYDVMELDDGEPVLVMDLLEGESLRARLTRDRKLSLADLATLALPVVSAVGTAHALGVVHRDLKPENIFLTREADGAGGVKVLDFGIAKLLGGPWGAAAGGTGALTGTGAMLGTPLYMAPEQVCGDGDIDHRADIWSLGVIVYECLTGTCPTAADNVGRILKIVLTNAIAPIAQVAPDLPEDVRALVQRMLSPDRAARPADLREVSGVLERYTTATARPFGAPSSVGPRPPAEASPPAAEPPPKAAPRSSADTPAATLIAPRAASPNAAARAAASPTAASPAAASPTAVSPAPAEAGRSTPRHPSWGPLGRGVLMAGLGSLAALVAVTVLFGLRAAGRRTGPKGAEASAGTETPGPCPKGMALIEGGTFSMGTEDGKEDEKPVHGVDVATFCLDRTEVTVGAYTACVAAGRCKPASGTVHWEGVPEAVVEYESAFCDALSDASDDAPINCTSWTLADEACRARGGRLPTEAEWEYAAGGGAEHRRYPWGDAPPGPGLLDACDEACAVRKPPQGPIPAPMYAGSDGFLSFAPVGHYPAGDARGGLHDMAGNVWEWTSSRHCIYPSHDCQTPNRVFRGGGWSTFLVANVRTTSRLWSAPDNRYNDVGFRCASTPEAH